MGMTGMMGMIRRIRMTGIIRMTGMIGMIRMLRMTGMIGKRG